MERNKGEINKKISKVRSWLFESNKIDKLLLRLIFKKEKEERNN